MAYNAGVENFQIPYDRTFFDQLNARKEGWSVVEPFTLTPEGDKPPMEAMGRAFDVDAGQVLRVSQPGERGDIADVMFLNRTNLDEHSDLSVQLAHEGICPCGDQTASCEDVALTPMKVEIFDTGSTSPEFKRFHNWCPHFKDMVVWK